MDYRDNLLANLKHAWKEALENFFPRQETNQLLNSLILHYTGYSRTDQALNQNYRLSESEMISINQAVKRLLKEEPIQYILGVSEFFGLQLKVNPAVLIPRPETEELVELILKQNKQECMNILDIGTGSGCIALALKSQLPQSNLMAFDVSEEALSIASTNARDLQLEVAFYHCDILSASDCEHGHNFDIIVNNPPYVTALDKQEMKNNVLDFEPNLALFVQGDDPLLFYRCIANYALDHLNMGGKIYFETNENFGIETASLLESLGFKQALVFQDIHGKNRFVSAER